ncbi:MAG: glycosyltransferase family 4 protein [Myxococcales bacterium]|nr:glycosyltransferase family 4 protein [Myxococcales bacterium]
MNIVHFTYGRVNPVSANGVNYVILNLSRALRSAGHDVRVVSFSRKDTTPTTLDRDGLPVEVYPDPMSGSLRGLTAIVERLETLRRRGELDVLHLHLAWHIHKVPIVRWALRSGVPYTVTTHCGYTQDRIAHHGWRKKLALATWETWTLNNASAVHVICKEEATDLRRLGVSAPLFQIYNGVDVESLPTQLDEMSLKRELSLPRDAVVGAFVGRLAPEKNVDGLVRALGLLRQRGHHDVHFALIGPYDQPTHDLLSSIARADDTVDRLHLLGARYGRAKYEALVGADFYVHPAWSDVVSIAVLEALALGLPTVVTRTSYVSYLYNTGAFVMAEPYPQELALGIAALLSRRSDWAQLGETSRQLIMSEFSWNAIAQRMADAYAALAEGRPPVQASSIEDR